MAVLIFTPAARSAAACASKAPRPTKVEVQVATWITAMPPGASASVSVPVGKLGGTV